MEYFWNIILLRILLPMEVIGHPQWLKTVKNLPVTQEIWVQSLGQEDPLEEGMAIPLQYSCLEDPMDKEAWWLLWLL